MRTPVHKDLGLALTDVRPLLGFSPISPPSGAGSFPPELLAITEMSLQDQLSMRGGVTLATGDLSLSREIKLQHLPEQFVRGDVFLLDEADFQLVREYVFLGSRLPPSSEIFEEIYPRFIERYLEYYRVGTYDAC